MKKTLAVLSGSLLLPTCAGGPVAEAPSRNRVDRPPEKWANAGAERAYLDCMRDLGWTPRAR